MPASIRKTLQAAAELQGSTLGQFIVRAALKRAQEILECESVMRLNQKRTRENFVLLDRPPRPNAALRAAKEVHQKLVRASH